MSEQVSSREKAPENLLVALKEAQARLGYLPRDFIMQLAGTFEVPVSDIYGIASFYSFLNIRPVGRHVIRVCKSLPCYLQSSQAIIDAVAGEIGLGPGGTTPDGRFSFELTNCIGLCDRAPAMLIDHDPHVDLTPSKIARILRDYE